MSTFQPIAPCKEKGASLPQLRKPAAARLPKGCGVQLGCVKKRELDRMLGAGRTGSPLHRLMEKRIQKERGGVLPGNWDVALSVKKNVEMMERACLC